MSCLLSEFDIFFYTMTYIDPNNYKNRPIRNIMSPNKDTNESKFERTKGNAIHLDEKASVNDSMNTNNALEPLYDAYHHQIDYNAVSHPMYDGAFNNNGSHHGSYHFEPNYNFREQFEFKDPHNHNKENLPVQVAHRKKYDSKTKGRQKERHQLKTRVCVEAQSEYREQIGQNNGISLKDHYVPEEHMTLKEQLMLKSPQEPMKQYNFIEHHEPLDQFDNNQPPYRPDFPDNGPRRCQDFTFDENQKKVEFDVMSRPDSMRDYMYNSLGVEGGHYISDYVKDYENLNSNRLLDQFTPHCSEHMAHGQYGQVNEMDQAIPRGNSHVMHVPKSSDHLNPRCLNLSSVSRNQEQSFEDHKLKMKRERNRIAAKKSRDKRLAQYQNLERIQKSQKETIRNMKTILLHHDRMLYDFITSSENIINELAELMHMAEQKMSLSSVELLNNLVMNCYNFSQKVYDTDQVLSSDFDNLPTDLALKITGRRVEKYRRKLGHFLRIFRNRHFNESV